MGVPNLTHSQKHEKNIEFKNFKDADILLYLPELNVNQKSTCLDDM